MFVRMLLLSFFFSMVVQNRIPINLWTQSIRSFLPIREVATTGLVCKEFYKNTTKVPIRNLKIRDEEFDKKSYRQFILSCNLIELEIDLGNFRRKH